MEKSGSLSWEELALARLKHKVSAKHGLGPKARKKPRKEKTPVDGIFVIFLLYLIFDFFLPLAKFLLRRNEI